MGASYNPDEVGRPALATVDSIARGSVIRFRCSRFIEFPRLSECLRMFNTCDFSGGVGSPERKGSGSPVEKSPEDRRRENLRRSRRGLRLSVRGVGDKVRLLTLTSRDVFPHSDRVEFSSAVCLFVRRTRHIFGAYVVCAELTKRQYCHAHFAVPDKSEAPSGHYSGYTAAELNEIRAIWRDCISHCAAPDRLAAVPAGKSLGNIHMTGSRPALGTSTYMAKSAAAYVSKDDGRDVFFSHRYRSSRGLVRVMEWHPCFQLAAPRADFAAGACEYYIMNVDADPFCSAIYDVFGPRPPS